MAAALTMLVFAVSSGGAASRVVPVYVQFSAYGPSQLDVLPGETVRWTNVSERTHTVTAYSGLFDSGDVPGGATFSFTFNTPGTYQYHCTIHPSITGEIDVRRLTLESLPPAAVPVGTRVEFAGITSDAGRPVVIEHTWGRSTSGSGRRSLAPTATGASCSPRGRRVITAPPRART